MKSYPTFFLIFIFIITITNAQDGQLDQSFGDAGLTTYSVSGLDLLGTDIEVLEEGKQLYGISSYTGDLYVAKLLENGTPDPSFGVDGYVTLECFGSFFAFVERQADGKIIAAATTIDNDLSSIIVYRLLEDGSIDNTFGTNGKRIISHPSNTGLVSHGCVVDENDNIIIAARNEGNIFVIGLNPDGSTNTNYGNNGTLEISPGHGSLVLYEIKQQPDGKLLLTGELRDNGNDNSFLYRLTTDGDLDGTFGNNGLVETDILERDHTVTIAVQDDDKILLGGFIGDAITGDWGMIRYNADGSLDQSFGDQGVLIYPLSDDYDHIRSLAIQEDGRILAAGYRDDNTLLEVLHADVALMRFLPDGTPDATFGDNGIVITDVENSPHASAMSMALDTDERILVTGFYDIGNFHFFAARYVNGQPFIAVTEPSLGDVFVVGNTETITWVSQEAVTVQLEYSLDGGANWNQIPGAENLPASDGSFVWDVPVVLSSNCNIRITETSGTGLMDISDTFTIDYPDITVVINSDSTWFDTDLDGRELNDVDGSYSSSQGVDITDYEWFVDGVSQQTGATAQLEITSGNHWISLKVTNALGFYNIDSMEVEVFANRVSIGGSIKSAVSTAGGMYFVSSENSSVYGFDSTGSILRQFATGGSLESTLSISSLGLLYAGSDDMRAYCFDADLNSVWDKAMGGLVKSSPAISADGQVIYIGTMTGVLKAVNAETGAPLWSYNTNNPIYSSPLVIEDLSGNTIVIFATSAASANPPKLVALKDLGSNYEFLWERELDASVNGSGAIYGNGSNTMIYIGDISGNLYRTRWDGYYEADWKVSTGGSIYGGPVISNDSIVYVGNITGYLYGYEAGFTETDTPVISYNAETFINGTPAIGDNGVIVFGTDDGRLCAVYDDGVSDELQLKWELNTNSQFASPVMIKENGIIMTGTLTGEVIIVVEPDLAQQKAAFDKVPIWGTFQGNNARSKVVSLHPLSNDDNNSGNLPTVYSLEQNYPNPFNPATTIEYSVPKEGFVSLVVYNIAGEKVATVVGEQQSAGTYKIQFDAAQLSSGVYFYRLESGSFVATKKFMLLK